LVLGKTRNCLLIPVRRSVTAKLYSRPRPRAINIKPPTIHIRKREGKNTNLVLVNCASLWPANRTTSHHRTMATTPANTSPPDIQSISEPAQKGHSVLPELRPISQIALTFCGPSRHSLQRSTLIALEATRTARAGYNSQALRRIVGPEQVLQKLLVKL
jgi:hypothetical protein